MDDEILVEKDIFPFEDFKVSYKKLIEILDNISEQIMKTPGMAISDKHFITGLMQQVSIYIDMKLIKAKLVSDTFIPRDYEVKNHTVTFKRCERGGIINEGHTQDE